MTDSDPSSPPGVELSRLRILSEEPPPITPEQLPAFREEVAALAASSLVDWAAPPFALPDPLTLPATASALEDFFYRLARLDGPIVSLLWWRASQDVPAEPATLPLLTVGEFIAADIDRGLGAGRANAYHNPQHFAEVLTSLHVLMQLVRHGGSELPGEAHATLLLAGLIHDWHHDGTTNAGIPFRLENRSLIYAQPYFRAAGLSRRTVQNIDLLVRATDTRGPHHFANAALAWHRLCLENPDARETPPLVPKGYEALAPLLAPEEALLAELSALLRDADVLASVGLSADYAAIQNARLEEEWATTFSPDDYRAFLNGMLGHPRPPSDAAPPAPYEDPDTVVTFTSDEGRFFNPNIAVVAAAALTDQTQNVAEAEAVEARMAEEGIDVSSLSEVQIAVTTTPSADMSPAEIMTLRTTLRESGFFDNPPFTMTAPASSLPTATAAPFRLGEAIADGLLRLHSIPGPIMSAVVAEIFEQMRTKPTDPVAAAAMSIARAIDMGQGTGTKGDNPAGERNPYHNKNHILDLTLLCHLLNLRAAQRNATASTPLARSLLILAALVCHWHHPGHGNSEGGHYHYYRQQDCALDFADEAMAEMQTELRLMLQTLVRCTDPREPLLFARSAYHFHLGVIPQPEVLTGCDPLLRLISDPHLAVLANRLNDAIYLPFVGLSAAYSARSIVELGREIGQPIDFSFVRRNLIAPLLSRPLFQGEQPPAALLIGRDRVVSFTSAEAQALFNPTLQSLLLAQG